MGLYGSHFLLCTGVPEGQQKNRKTQKVTAFPYGRAIQVALKSDRPNPVPGSFREVRMHPMMCNRDHLGELHHVIVWAIICNNKQAPRTNSNATVHLTVFQNFSRQHPNSIQTEFKTVIENLDFFRTVIKQNLNSIQTSFLLF